MSNLSNAIARTDDTPAGPVAALNSDAALNMIAESLPAGMDASTVRRHAITLVKQNDDLLRCDAASVVQGIVRGAALGLDPDPALGQMWLVPRNVKVGGDWQKVASFQVGWRGLYELAMRTGRVAKIEVKAVHQRDRFEARLGSGGGLTHEPDWFGDRGPVIGWYAYAELKDGTQMFEVLSRPDAERHRDAHASTKDRKGDIYGPWKDHFDAMAQKTVFLKLAKWLPKQVERTAFDRALEVDGIVDRTPVGGTSGPKDVIEATHVPDPPAADDVVDAELMEAELPLADENGDPIPSKDAARNKRMWALVAEAWPDDDTETRDRKRKALIGTLSNGATESSKGLCDADWEMLFDSLDVIKDGSHELFLRSSGGYELRRKGGAK